MCNLAVCYLNGIGVEEDMAQAVAWFQKAVEGGSARPRASWGLLPGWPWGGAGQGEGPLPLPGVCGGRLPARHMQSGPVL